MIFYKIRIICNILINSFCGSGIITTIGKSFIDFTPFFKIIIYNTIMNISSNINNGNIIKRIVTFEPITIKFKDLCIKWRVISDSILYLILFEISNHLLTDVSILCHFNLSASHAFNIERLLVCKVCS